MSLAKLSEKRERLSAGRSRSQHSFRPANRPDSSNSFAAAQGGARAGELSFAEDFMLEHTHTGLRIALLGIAGKSGSAPREQQKSAQCYGFPS